MHRDFAKGILFVLGLGSLIPGAGCLWSGDDDDIAQLCASPAEGDKYCVSARSGPSAAWNDAMAHGTEPIQMWALWPEKYELQDVVSSPPLIKAWLDDGQAILNYLRVTKGSAESYHATMNGKMADDLRRARRIQGDLVGTPRKPVDFLKAEFVTNAIKGETAVTRRIRLRGHGRAPSSGGGSKSRTNGLPDVEGNGAPPGRSIRTPKRIASLAFRGS